MSFFTFFLPREFCEDDEGGVDCGVIRTCSNDFCCSRLFLLAAVHLFFAFMHSTSVMSFTNFFFVRYPTKSFPFTLAYLNGFRLSFSRYRRCFPVAVNAKVYLKNVNNSKIQIYYLHQITIQHCVANPTNALPAW